MFTKNISILIVIMLVVSVLSSCRDKSKMSGINTDSKMVISIANWVSGPVDENNYVKQELEKTFSDVKFEFIPFERATFKDQLNTRIAGGDVPDIIVRQFADELTDFAKQKIITEVPYDLIKKNAPNIFSATKEFGTEVWFATMYDNKNYGIPLMIQSNITPFTNGFRQDWLEKVGITKTPETISEYEDAFDKFVNKDPDGNGQKDTYALSAQGMDKMKEAFNSIFFSNGVTRSWMLQSDGSVEEGSVLQGSKETLKILADWYKKGYIDPEFITTDRKISEQKWNNGKVGFIETQWFQLGSPNGPLYNDLKVLNDKAKIAKAYAPKGPDGKFGYGGWGKITGSLAFGVHLKKDQPKLERALQIIDKISSEKDLWQTISKGKKGVHYNLDEKGYAKKLEPFETTQKLGSVGTLFFTSWSPIPKVQNELAVADNKENMKYSTEGNVVDGKDYFSWIYIRMTPDDRQLYEKLTTMANKAFIEMIIGTKPIEYFDEFVEKWNAAGGIELKKRATEIYKEGSIKRDELENNFR